MSYIAQNIRKLRKAKGLTQPQLAAQVGLTQKRISDYELSKSTPSIDALPRLANFFGITVDELVGARQTSRDLVTSPPAKRRHGNSRTARLLELFEQLTPEEQRTTLKQIKGIVANRVKR